MPKVSDSHREARRAQILHAAIACFGEEGFHRTTMEDIIRRSDLSAGAIYQYFPGKTAIVEAIAAERHAEETALVAKFMESDDLGAGLAALARGLFDLLKKPGEGMRRRVGIQVWAEALRSEEIMRLVLRGNAQTSPMTRKFAEARAAGRFPKHLDPAAFTQLVLAIFQGFILQQAWEPEISVDKYLSAALYLIDSSFGSAPSSPQTRERKRATTRA